jgi:hypothetical protein
MNLEEQFDPDEVLRDIGDQALEEDIPEDVREVSFGTLDDENANFKDFESDFDI